MSDIQTTGTSLAVHTTVNAPARTVFDVLADPTTHARIDGTGWVREPVDGARLTGAGQIFRMGMYHENHPHRHYEIANRVEVFDPPHAIAWQPGAEPRHIPGRGADATGPVEFGGWIWRYDLAPQHAPGAPAGPRVTLTYDWSQVPAADRRAMRFPPFPPEHLVNSLRHLKELAERDVPR
jgi:hypothetical protein